MRPVLLLALFLIAACSVPPAADSGGPELYLQPYLLHKDHAAAVIGWRTIAAVPGRIRHGTTPACRDGLIRTAPGLAHTAELTGLRPDTVYWYQVDGAPLASFRTAAAGAERTFAVLSHSWGSVAPSRYPTSFLVDRIARLQPDFVIHAGDVTFFSDRDHFRNFFFRPFEPVLAAAPVYLAPANHDSGFPFLQRGIDLTVLRELFPRAYGGGPGDGCFEIVQGSVRFLFLSYLTPLGPGSAQREWLRQRLREVDHDFTAVVFGGSHREFYDEPSLLALLVEHGVDFVLRGDGLEPDDWRGEHRGMPMFTVGDAGDRPAAFLLGRQSEGMVMLRQMRADGSGGPHVLLKTRRERTGTRVPMERVFAQGQIVGYAGGPELPVPSTSVRGVQLRCAIASTKAGAIGIIAVPAGVQVADPIAGFCSQMVPLEPADRHVLLAVQQRDHHTGQPFTIGTIKVVISGFLPEEVRLEEALLY
ncbi:MAG: hypothetical protein FJ265_12425 [Planctomycetes bacterium]|nr:hypothetical protein [Planctomycetota bacterium]